MNNQELTQNDNMSNKPGNDNTQSKEKAKRIVVFVSIITAFIVVVVGVITVFCSGVFSNKLVSDDEKLKEGFEDYFEIQDEISQITSSYLDDDSFVSDEKAEAAIKKVGEYAGTLKSNDDIEDYYVTEGVSVWMQLNSGVEYIYMPPLEDVASIPVSTYHPCYSTFSDDLKEYCDTAIDAPAKCFEAELDGYVFNNSYRDENASIDAMKNIGSNGVVFYNGHGGYSDKTHSFLMTGLKLDHDKFYYDPIYYIQNIGYTDDFLSGRIVFISEGNTGYAAVTSKFFDKYLGNISSKVIYLGACYSGTDDVLANSFIKKGAGAVVGNTDKMNVVYNFAMMKYFIGGVLGVSDGKYMTVQDAIDFAKHENRELSNSVNYVCNVIAFGNSELSFSSDAKPTEKPTEIPKEDNTSSTKKKKDTPVTFDITRADVEVGSAIDIYCTSGHNLDNGTLKTSAGDYSKCFKIYILGDRFNFIANQEGTESFTFTSESGEVGSFTLNAIQSKEIDADYTSYLGTWDYVFDNNGELDNDHALVTEVTFNEINGTTASFRLFKGNIVALTDIEATGEIIDGRIDFSYDMDGWGSSGHGTITLNGDSIHLFAVVDNRGPGARIALESDDDLIRY